MNMTDNEFIAEFMGFKRTKSSLGNTLEHPNMMGVYGGTGLKLKYDTSWDWLMPVVEKIENLGLGVVIESWPMEWNDSPIKGHRVFIHEKPDDEPITEATGISKMSTTYKAVVEFIKWYNENKTK